MRFLGLIFVVILIAAAIAKPTQEKLTQETMRKLGIGSNVLLGLAHLSGVSELKYHDYVFYSSLTSGEKTVSVGAFQLVYLTDAASSLRHPGK